MLKEPIVRSALFCLFISVGVGAVALAILADELLEWDMAGITLQKTDEVNEKLRELCGEYDAVLSQIQNEPNIITRLERVNLGAEPNSADTAYPRLIEKNRRLAELVLAENKHRQSKEPRAAGWIKRCSDARGKKVLFFAGAALIIISFVFFGSGRAPENSETGLPLSRQ